MIKRKNTILKYFIYKWQKIFSSHTPRICLMHPLGCVYPTLETIDLTGLRFCSFSGQLMTVLHHSHCEDDFFPLWPDRISSGAACVHHSLYLCCMSRRRVWFKAYDKHSSGSGIQVTSGCSSALSLSLPQRLPVKDISLIWMNVVGKTKTGCDIPDASL